MAPAPDCSGGVRRHGFSRLTDIGDVPSLIIHSASTTHSQQDEEQSAATGTSPGPVRLSVGIENLAAA
ncbi:hypothetical protein SGFS_015900 [Streptomyces graminofaciens]|jgi:O-acetylhomoserine (thiol)-lyase|uniref:Uncharacterized protein n=1 Tax=Streptomyces graminofaciens TaxID=68212 RepID=A0ABN5VAL8_9ACTN|nr:hypothetical protein SGFS_015900 [Streptomyces graminofaciens]